MKLIRVVPVLVLCFCGVVHAQEVSNPVYEAWAKQKPGATVTMKIHVTVEGQAEGRDLVQKETLKEVFDSAVIVERTMVREMGGTKVEEPGERVKVPATIDSQKAGLPMRSLDEMTVTGMKEGKEAVEVQGKKVEAVTREFSITMTKGDKSAAGTIKTWFSAEVPGGLVKVESTFGKPAQTAVMTLSEVTAGK